MFDNLIININEYYTTIFIFASVFLLLFMLKNIMSKNILYYFENYLIIKILLLSLLLLYIYTENVNIVLVVGIYLFILYSIAIKLDKENFSENYNEISNDIDRILIEKIEKIEKNNYYEDEDKDIEDFTPENLKYLNY